MRGIPFSLSHPHPQLQLWSLVPSGGPHSLCQPCGTFWNVSGTRGGWVCPQGVGWRGGGARRQVRREGWERAWRLGAGAGGRLRCQAAGRAGSQGGLGQTGATVRLGLGRRGRGPCWVPKKEGLCPILEWPLVPSVISLLSIFPDPHPSPSFQFILQKRAHGCPARYHHLKWAWAVTCCYTPHNHPQEGKSLYKVLTRRTP